MRFVGIDPSTKTGLVILNKDGNIIDTMEITSKAKDPERMSDIIREVANQLELDDVIAIEGFAFGAKGNAVGIQYGLGYGIRIAMFEEDLDYIEVSPSALKKYASGKGNTKKDELAVHIYKQWNFESRSDNVRDAFVLAQIARSIRMGTFNHKYQSDVIQAILAPSNDATKKKGGKGNVNKQRAVCNS